MILDIRREFLLRLFKEMPDSLDDSDVGLMQKIMIYLRGLHTGFIQCSFYILCCRGDSELEHFLSLHLQWYICFLFSNVRSRLQCPVLPQFLCSTCRRKLYTLDIVSRSQDSRSSTITAPAATMPRAVSLRRVSLSPKSRGERATSITGPQ